MKHSPPHAQVIRKLRDYAAQHGEIITAKWLETHDPKTYRLTRMLFDGFANAREAAGLPKPSQRIWTEERVIDALRKLQLQGRVRMTTVDLVKAGHGDLVSAIYNVIGSISRARRLAGIPDPGRRDSGRRQRWNEDRVWGEIRERHRQGLPLASTKVPAALLRAAARFFGSWRSAIEAAGLEYETTLLHRRPWTRDDVLALVSMAVEVRTCASEDAPTLKDLVAPAKGALRRMFGGVHGALLALGIDPKRVMRHLPAEGHTDEELLDALRAMVQAQPTITSAKLFRSKLGRQALTRFGGHRASREKMGIPGWPARPTQPFLAADEVQRGLLERHRRGDWMSQRATLRDEPRLARSAIWRFGSWGAALRAAGLGELVGKGATAHSAKRATRPAEAGDR